MSENYVEMFFINFSDKLKPFSLKSFSFTQLNTGKYNNVKYTGKYNNVIQVIIVIFNR